MLRLDVDVASSLPMKGVLRHDADTFVLTNTRRGSQLVGSIVAIVAALPVAIVAVAIANPVAARSVAAAITIAIVPAIVAVAIITIVRVAAAIAATSDPVTVIPVPVAPDSPTIVAIPVALCPDMIRKRRSGRCTEKPQPQNSGHRSRLKCSRKSHDDSPFHFDQRAD